MKIWSFVWDKHETSRLPFWHLFALFLIFSSLLFLLFFSSLPFLSFSYFFFPIFFLQENYNTLLIKYAEAENTIDRLRLEAKVIHLEIAL